IARTAWVILSENLGVLADRARLDPHELHRVVLSVPGVRGAHAIRTRGSPDHVHVDLHVHLDPQMPLAQAHERTHAVVDALRARFPQIADVVVHAEPADGRERDLSRIAPR
ncbi:MAG: cation transporter dimerization domain-containing protein, partial [Myxococcales bacterium]|nr:cation transporter dimerization domain-containing protein [Myxococcales bacterium]